MPFTIAIWHQKGGVAKTTTAIALGACFAERGHETLLIDLDPQGNLTSGLGFDPEQERASSADVLLGNDTLAAVSRETSLPGLDLAPSNPDMVTLPRWLHLREKYEPLLRQALGRPEVAHYRMAIMDCPPMLGPLTVAALTAADLVLIPTQCEYFSVQTLANSLDLVQLVRGRTNPRLAYRILVTMFDGRGLLHSRVLAQLQGVFSDALLQTMIGVDSKVRESQLAGRPITLHANSSRAAQQYRQLAEELLTYAQRSLQEAA
jgi:chromosome partitioning protein